MTRAEGVGALGVVAVEKEEGFGGIVGLLLVEGCRDGGADTEI